MAAKACPSAAEALEMAARFGAVPFSGVSPFRLQNCGHLWRWMFLALDIAIRDFEIAGWARSSAVGALDIAGRACPSDQNA